MTGHTQAPPTDQPSASTDADPLLHVSNLHTHFKTNRGYIKSVNGVSLTVRRGRVLGVVGESGSGKTILSRSIMGLLPSDNVYRSGSVLFDETELTTLPAASLKRLWGTKISMIFQDPTTSLNPVMRVGRQITETLRVHLSMGKDEAREHAVALLAQVGISSPSQCLRQFPAQLSGGMRQRVMIAVALACSPRLLLADEPTTGLDVTIQAQVLDLLAQLQRERNMAMILVTHDLGAVASRADEIAVMYAGRIVEIAPTKSIFASPKMPYTQGLLNSIPKITNPSHTRLHSIPGRPPDPLAVGSGCEFAPRCDYVQSRCLEQRPPLSPSRTRGHNFACWYPLHDQSDPVPSSSTRHQGGLQQ